MSNALNIGDECQYIYKGPHGFSIKPELFPATVTGFTKFKVKIKAFDGREHFTATVNRESLKPND